VPVPDRGVSPAYLVLPDLRHARHVLPGDVPPAGTLAHVATPSTGGEGVNKSDLLANQAHKSQHYKDFKIEPLQYIEENSIGFHEGNIIKYVSRWRQKDGVDDLKKAKFYIERLIELAAQEVNQ
jgi:Protein of unknwon function (DUF3310)